MKLLIAALLTAFSTGAMAEWTYLTSGKDSSGSLDVYIDKTTIRKRGNVAKMWLMQDYKALKESEGVAPFLSQKCLKEYDCVEVMSKLNNINNYSDHMGNGESSFSYKYNDNNWQDMTPGSIGMMEWKAACKK